MNFPTNRLLKIALLAVLLLLPVVSAVSREANPAVAQIGVEQTADPFQPIDPENTPEPTPFPSPTPVISADVQLLLAARDDLELLADQELGFGVRPQGWNGRVNRFDPQIALLTRLDLELLAGTLIAPDRRPSNWIGAVGSTPFAVARDVRHDLEILADLISSDDSRPVGWVGGDPLLRCSRATQTLINLLERGGVFRLQIPANDPDFCKKAEIEVTVFTEQQILGNAQIGELFTSDLFFLSPNNITSDIAIAFLDSGATIRVGVIPNGTPIQVIARSYADFSNMMLVSGDGFELFIEYTNTNVTDRQFRNLPNIASLEVNTFCLTEWCSN